jgi:hypothetical protein
MSKRGKAREQGKKNGKSTGAQVRNSKFEMGIAAEARPLETGCRLGIGRLVSWRAMGSRKMRGQPISGSRGVSRRIRTRGFGRLFRTISRFLARWAASSTRHAQVGVRSSKVTLVPAGEIKSRAGRGRTELVGCGHGANASRDRARPYNRADREVCPTARGGGTRSPRARHR